MKLKQILCFILVIAMFLAIASCAANDKDKPDDNKNPLLSETESEPEVTFDVPDDLDFDGHSFLIMTCPGETEKTAYIFTSWNITEDTGEVLDTAFYQRNLWLEEYFNMTIAMDLRGGLTDTTRFSRSVSAGEPVDLGIWIDRYALSLAQGGYVRPYTQLAYIDLSKPWWYQKLNAQLSLGNKLYMASGHHDIMNYSAIQSLVYNTTIAEDIGLGSLYDRVDNGTWTMDVMYDMMLRTARDLNGDSVMTDKDDQWGAVFTGSMWTGSFYSVNRTGFIMKDDEDMPYLAALEDEKLYNILDKLVNKIQDKNIAYEMNERSYYAGGHIYENTVRMFTAGNTLFCGATLAYLDHLREMDSYGIMPFPKYEEVPAGTDYDGYSCCSLYYIVPKNHVNSDIPGAVLEAMAYISYQLVSPAYLETVLTVKRTRDEKSGEIIKMINKNVYRDLIHAYWLDQLSSHVGSSMGNNLTNYISAWTKAQTTYQRVVDKTYEAFEDMNDGY